MHGARNQGRAEGVAPGGGGGGGRGGEGGTPCCVSESGYFGQMMLCFFPTQGRHPMNCQKYPDAQTQHGGATTHTSPSTRWHMFISTVRNYKTKVTLCTDHVSVHMFLRLEALAWRHVCCHAGRQQGMGTVLWCPRPTCSTGHSCS